MAEQKWNTLASIMVFKYAPEDIQEQVSKYDTLKIWKSFRGIGMLSLLLAAAISSVLWFINIVATSTGDIIFLVVLSLFVYRGLKWALVVAIVYWTGAKVMILNQMATGVIPTIAPIAQILWWYAYVYTFVGAYKVESARKRQAV